MTALQNDAHIDKLCADNQYEKTTQESLATCRLQPLSQQEISEVAGGPEVDVGNGISPP